MSVPLRILQRVYDRRFMVPRVSCLGRLYSTRAILNSFCCQPPIVLTLVRSGDALLVEQ